MLQTWEAIKKITDNHNLIFKVVKINGGLEENYFMMVTYWCAKPFIRYFSVYPTNAEFSNKINIITLKDSRQIAFLDAMPLSDNVRWIETNELEGLF